MSAIEKSVRIKPNSEGVYLAVFRIRSRIRLLPDRIKTFSFM